MNIRQLLEQGHAAIDAEHEEKERLKRGSLRIGSAGCVTDAGEVRGECHRIALARTLGVDKEADGPRKIMFAAGNANEDVWADLLTRSWDGIILREEDIPVTWIVPGSTTAVMGRPDLVLADKDGKPVHGLELKGVYSSGTAVGVEVRGEPQEKHLIQAAGYSMFLNIPYTLCYTNPAVVTLNYFESKESGLKKLQPFYRMFDLIWRDDQLYYKDEFSSDEVATPITKKGIQDYYKLLVEMQERKSLGPRPANTAMDGRKMPWDRCDAKYCSFADSCDQHEQNYDAWIASIADDS